MDFITKFYITVSFLQLCWPIYIFTQPYENWALTTSSCCMLLLIILQVIFPITWRQRYFRDLLLTKMKFFIVPSLDESRGTFNMI